MRRWCGVAFLMVLAGSGCSNDTACATSAECFQGEICIDQRCELASNSDPDANPANNANNVIANNGQPNDASDPDGGGGGGDVSGPNSERIACVVDPFQNVCDDDQHEPNENVNGLAPLPFDNQSWCNGTTLVPTQTSETLTLCAGDELDLYRLMIDNRAPNACLTNQFTWQVEVRFRTACTEDLVAIEPYFSSPYTDNLCEEDARFRCEWSDDEQTFTVQYLVAEPEQLMDFNLAIGPPSADTTTLQFDYEIVMTLTQ